VFKHCYHAFITGVLFALWWLLRQWFFKDFQISTYWNLVDGSIFANVWLVILPVVIYGFILGQVAWLEKEHELSPLAKQGLLMKGAVSLSAGLFEELAHRGVYIYFGLIFVYLSNRFFSWTLGIVMVVLILAVLFELGKVNWFIAALLAGGLALLWRWIYSIAGENPIYEINGWIFDIYLWLAKHAMVVVGAIGGLMAILTWVRVKVREDAGLGDMSVSALLVTIILFAAWFWYVFPLGFGAIQHMPIVPVEADRLTGLLYIGAVLWCNVKFREGHKYQGPAGMLHSYMFGFYMFYIAFTYGLVYAIITHFVYDLVLLTSEHVVLSLRGRLS